MILKTSVLFHNEEFHLRKWLASTVLLNVTTTEVKQQVAQFVHGYMCLLASNVFKIHSFSLLLHSGCTL